MEPKNELQRNAVARARRKELETYQRALDIQWLNSRMEDGRMGRCLALIQREADMEKEFQERTDHAAIVNARAERETGLGIEVAKIRREEVCQLLRRHYLRERDPSLRELMKKLQAGYVCRDLQLQIQNNEYRRLQEKAEEKQANTVLQKALYNDHEVKMKEEKEKMFSTRVYRKELQRQLINKEKERQCQYEDTLIEKKMLEEVMRTIADEDHKELEQKRTNQARLRAEMETSQRARAAWRDKQAACTVREQRDLQRQRAAAADRSAAIIAERERKMREKEELNQKIAAKIMADEAAIRERENIIMMLQEQEYLEKNVQDDLQEKQKQQRVKRDNMRTLTQQMQNRRRLQRLEKDAEARLRTVTEAKVAAENQKELEKELKKKEKRRQYAEDLKRQIRDNVVKRDKDKRLEDGRAAYVWDCDRAWREEVARERKEIIKEHAPPLLGYLQPALLAPADLPALREGARARAGVCAQLDVGALESARAAPGLPKCNAQCRVLREY